jgi:hypothetical protein
MIERALETDQEALLARRAEVLQAYWDQIDQDPEVARRRAEIEKAEDEGRVPEGATYPSER